MALEQSDLERAEAAFHDSWAASVDPDSINIFDHFESEACPENRKILQELGALKGKRILEIGCGFGEASVYFALQGAVVTATDISQEMLTVVERLASRHHVQVTTVCCSAMDLSIFNDESFDFVYAANMLHHVEIEPTMREIVRKLKPGGRAFFTDPLAYNPLIYCYRLMATKYRTKDETPLCLGDITRVRENFHSVRENFFWLTSLGIFLKFFLIDRLHPNDVRYWKLVIQDSRKYRLFLRWSHALDRILLRLPVLRLLSWNVLLICEKSRS